MQQTISAHLKVVVPTFTVAPLTVDYGTTGPDSFPSVTVTVTNPTSVDMNGITAALVGAPTGITLSTGVLPNVPANSSIQQSLQLHVPAGAAEGDFNFSITLTK